MDDNSQLERFVDAQNSVFNDVLEELRKGQKTSHWMWFVFPQLKGLGSSSMAQRFGISGRAEAEAYLKHPVLGPRLTECTRLVNVVQDRSAEEIFGAVDAMKFRSSMTLFSEIAGPASVFGEALHKYFNGRPDQLTLQLL